MTNDWNKVKQQVAAFRKYVNDLPVSAKDKSAYCYMVTKEEVAKLLNQRNDVSLLDGISIYFGANNIDGQMVPNIHIIACEKDANGDYHDYRLSNELPADAATISNSMPLLAEGRPCPVWCGKQNFLNS